MATSGIELVFGDNSEDNIIRAFAVAFLIGCDMKALDRPQLADVLEKYEALTRSSIRNIQDAGTWRSVGAKGIKMAHAMGQLAAFKAEANGRAGVLTPDDVEWAAQRVGEECNSIQARAAADDRIHTFDIFCREFVTRA